MIRILLPTHLQMLAKLPREVKVPVDKPVTQRRVVAAVEAMYPALRGTIWNHAKDKRRARLRFFAGQEDLSHDSPDEPLPAAVQSGDEPFFIVAAIAGG